MASSSGAPKEWSVMRRENNRNCFRMTCLQSSTRVIKTLRVVDICVKNQSRILTIDEDTTKNTLSSTTSLKYWRQYLLQKGKSKLSLPTVPTPPPSPKHCCGANQAATEKKQLRGERSRLLCFPTYTPFDWNVLTIYMPNEDHSHFRITLKIFTFIWLIIFGCSCMLHSSLS